MPLTDRALIVDYRLFGAPLPRADALPRHSPFHGQWPRLNIHIGLLDGRWSLVSGHWSADLAAGRERAEAARDQPADEVSSAAF